MGRPHTRHRRPVPRRIEEMPVAANNSRFDNRARTSCLRSASRAGIIAGSLPFWTTARACSRRRASSGMVAPETQRPLIGAARGVLDGRGNKARCHRFGRQGSANQRARRRHVQATPAALRNLLFRLSLDHDQPPATRRLPDRTSGRGVSEWSRAGMRGCASSSQLPSHRHCLGCS
jgi:hypothetical protein